METSAMQGDVHNLRLTFAAVSDVLLPFAPRLLYLSTGNANAQR